MPAVFLEDRACSLVSDCENNMALSGRCKERVDYVALNNLSSVDVETVNKRKRKCKPGQNYIRWKDLSPSGNRRLR